MQEVTYNGVPLSQLPPAAAPVDPCSVMPGDREFMELLRAGRFEEALRRFPKHYTNVHVSFLCGYLDGPDSADGHGPIPPLTEERFVAAIDYIEGPCRYI